VSSSSSQYPSVVRTYYPLGSTTGVAGQVLIPSRYYSAMTIDSAGAVWIHGGRPANLQYGGYSDLWKCNISMSPISCAWMRGSSSVNDYTSVSYGTMGTASPYSLISPRNSHSVAYDPTTKFIWIYGGHGLFSGSQGGYAADLWLIDINECGSLSCLNGGTCLQLTTDYHTCMCPAGFNGTDCEMVIDYCTSNPCQNGATCMRGINSFYCACAAGFSGPNCQTNSNECASNPCMNGGSCVDGIASFVCRCAAGFFGNLCESQADMCTSNPCMNGGICQKGINSFNCACIKGFKGVLCQTAGAGTLLSSWTTVVVSVLLAYVLTKSNQ